MADTEPAVLLVPGVQRDDANQFAGERFDAEYQGIVALAEIGVFLRPPLHHFG
jgi:hypothetical protein